jgi:hypothetical protein
MDNSLGIEHAVGKSIARGTGYMSGLRCTGANQVIPVTILADPTGPPFRNGTTIADARLSAYGYGAVSMGGSATAAAQVKVRQGLRCLNPPVQRFPQETAS